MKTHRTDVFSLVFGLIFLAAPVVWLLTRGREVEPERLLWLVAFVLIGLGFLGLLGALRSNRRRPPEAPAEAAAETAETTGEGAS